MQHEYIVNRHPERAPTHPGAIIQEDILPALKISVTQAAKEFRVSRQTLHKILAEKTSIAPEMALKLAKFCGNTPAFWLRMQQQCDLWYAEIKIHDELKVISTHGEVFVN